jgi:hypothetical protein
MNNISILGILFFGIPMIFAIFAFIEFTRELKRELKRCSADFPKER